MPAPDPLTATTWQLAAAWLTGDDTGTDLILDALDVDQLRTLAAGQAAAIASLLVASGTGTRPTTAQADHPEAAAVLLSGLRDVLADHATHTDPDAAGSGR